jgi:hypothetical protein
MTMTKKEKQLNNKLVDLGCIVCKLYFNVYSPPELHHVKISGQSSMGKKQAEKIPLCPNHHRNSAMAFHVNRKAFNKAYGSQEYLLTKTLELL